jgi:hypothetical protein
MRMAKTSCTATKIMETQAVNANIKDLAQFSLSPLDELPTQPPMQNRRALNTRLTTPRIIMNSGKFSSQLHIVGLSWEPHAKFASQRNVYENIMLSKGTESMQDIKNTPAEPAAQTSTLDVGVTDEIGT